MGNVSSADQDKVNELLTRRAKKKFIASERKQRQQLQKLQLQQQQLKLSEDTVSSPVSVNSDSARQANFYSTRMAISPHTPHPNSYTSHAPSTLSSPTHTHYHYKSSSENSSLSPTVSATALSIPASTATTSLSTQVYDAYVPIKPPSSQGPANLRLLGTSPEAKDWLKQKPRSSAHMLHQYNFHSHQYYQPPGSVKIVNNTCRNMSGVPHVPNLIRTNACASTSTLGSPVATTAVNGANKPSVPSTIPKPRPNSITAAAAAMAAAVAQREAALSQSNPAEGDNQSAATPTEYEHFDGHFHGHGHSSTPASPPPPPPPLSLPSLRKDPRAGRLVMSWSKLNTPSISSLSSAVSSSSSRLSAGSTPGSPIDQQTPDSSLTSPSATEKIDKLCIETAELYEHPPGLRPSSTLSSLRSLFGNHPQGLSLIESLEEEDEEDGIDSLSDTESESPEPEKEQENNNGRLKSRKRPAPHFSWMEERKRLSASSIPTISQSVHDSQKGQHALWKYIGGGNAHAPLRYDIDRILDSGCGLGEWAMEMAKEYPSATVYGVDLNPDLFPSMSQPVPSNCLFVQSNILSRLSFPDRYFDFVYQRFLYLGLTIDDWPVALKELRRVMKPGGWIELFEPCMRVHRAGPRTREVMRWISRLLQEERGLDFDFAGEKMKRLCESEVVGFQNVKLERLSIPVGAWGGRVGEAMAENMVLMFQNLQSALRESGSYPRDQVVAKAYGAMVQSWIRECEENKSYIDYYILVGQRAPE
ncbi:hypothetical protein BGW39_004135 [Mortierella sp. 14UC]|nr:hypothetical protein BGW39_004135 [Mortierella sp. 14UC]